MRNRLGSEGRMVHFSYNDPTLGPCSELGSFQVVKMTSRRPQRYGRNSLVEKKKLEKKEITSKDDCCEIGFSHPLLSIANVIMSPTIPDLFSSDDVLK